jgi:hypothetical protein
MRALVLVPVLAAVLALPAAAGAKEITAVTVCGAHRCTRLTDHVSMDAFMHAGGLAEEAPRAPQRSYLLRVHVSEPGGGEMHAWSSRWLPDAGVIASHEDNGALLFTSVDPALERVLSRAAHRAGAPRPARRFVRHDPQARVVEVVEPPRAPQPQPATAGAAGDGLPPVAWAGLAVAALALFGGVGVARARRR